MQSLIQRFRSLGLRNRLQVIFIAVALIPALAISVWAISVEYSNGRQQALHRLQSAASLKNLELASWINKLQSELSIPLSEEFGFERASAMLKLEEKVKYYGFYTKAFRNRLIFYISQSQQLQEIFLLNPQGEIILSTVEANEGISFTNDLETPISTILFKNNALYILYPIYDQDNTLIGALVGRTSSDTLIGILKELNELGQTGKSYLLDNQVVPLAASFDLPTDQTIWLIQANAFNTSGLNIAIQEHRDGHGIYTDYEDSLVIGFYHWIPEIPAGIIIEQNLSEAFSTLVSTLAVSLVIVLSAVFLAIVVSWLTTREIARPIENLAIAATQVAHGDLEQTVQVESKDEIGILAEAFNSMTNQLRNLINSLELRVEERTNRVLEKRALQLEISATVSREVISILNINDLLVRVVELIRDTFGYYHTFIYLIDEKSNQLVYQAGTEKIRAFKSFFGRRTKKH